MQELNKREVHNSRTLHLLLLRESVNLIMMSEIKVPKFFLEQIFANSFVALILSQYYINVNFL